MIIVRECIRFSNAPIYHSIISMPVASNSPKSVLWMLDKHSSVKYVFMVSENR